jgi:uncharacterized membrane protein YphA (DoxX/SURF4 family)
MKGVTMDVAATVMSIMLAVLFLTLGTSKLLMVPFQTTMAERLGVSANLYRVVGALEVAATAGLVVGLFWAPLGVAAAIGLVLLLIGAAGAHRRAGDGPKETLPAVWLALVSAATAVVTVVAA